MRIGIVIPETDPWGFFNDIYEDMSQNYKTTIFKNRSIKIPILNGRVNQYLFYKDLRGFLRSNDIVFFEWASELLAVASNLPKTCRIITRLHRYELYQWADKINWDNVDKIILVSKAKEREFITKFPSQASKTVVLSVSTSLEKFKPQQKQFNGDIGTLCHITPRKRVYDLILTFSELADKRDDLHLHIAGDKENGFEDYFQAIRRIVNKLNLQNRIIFYGKVSDPWNWYSKIDIFISNSFSEGLQVAPMEAMASGCYCLSHSWDGAEELLPPENLYFTNSELQEKILNYCYLDSTGKQKKRDLMRELACEKFDINQTKAQIRQVIQELAGREALR